MGPYREATRTRYRREWQHFIDESANDEDFFFQEEEEDYPYHCTYDDACYGNGKNHDEWGCTHNLTVEAGEFHRGNATTHVEKEVLETQKSSGVSLKDFFTDMKDSKLGCRSSQKGKKRERKHGTKSQSSSAVATSSSQYVTLDEDGTIWECLRENVNIGNSGDKSSMILPLEAVLPTVCASPESESWKWMQDMDEKRPTISDLHGSVDDTLDLKTRAAEIDRPATLRRSQSCPHRLCDHSNVGARPWSSRDRFRGVVRCTNLILEDDCCGTSTSSSMGLTRHMDIFCASFGAIFTVTWSAGPTSKWERLYEEEITNSGRGKQADDLAWYELQIVPLVLPSALSESEAVVNDDENLLVFVENLRTKIHALVRSSMDSHMTMTKPVADPRNVPSSFVELSRLLSALQPEITKLIDAHMQQTFPTSMRRNGSVLQSVLGKAHLPAVAQTFDDYDVYQRTETSRRNAIQKQYESELWGESATTIPLQRCFECPPRPKNEDEAPPDMGNVCMVCFDDLSSLGDTDVVQLLPCGHRACLDCWRGNLESASRSGDTNIRCLAYRCPTVISIHDIAHLLEGEQDDKAKRQNNHSTLRKLVRYHLDHSTMLHLCENQEEMSQNTPEKSQTASESSEEAPSVRYCSTPSCKCVHVAGRCDPTNSLENLIANLVDEEDNGDDGGVVDDGAVDSQQADLAIQHLIRGADNVWFCRCGATYCGNCKTGTASPAHVGLSCANYAKLRKSLDYIEGEVKSIEWLKTNTRPCPRCKFPIQKNGGCNHMWCNKCGYYFCWMCGGPGGECRAFVCAKDNLLWHQEASSVQEEEQQLPSLVLDFKNYRVAYWNLQRIIRQRRGASLPERSMAALTAHYEGIETNLCLYQILMWQCLVLLQHSSEQEHQNSASIHAIRKAKQRIELLIHSKNLRELARSMGKTVAEIVGNGAPAVPAASSLVQAATFHPGEKKTTSRRKEQALQSIAQKRQDRGSTLVNDDTFQLMMADEELAVLYEMDDKAFASILFANMVRCVRTLVEDKKPSKKQLSSRTGSNSPKNKLQSKSASTTAAYLNEKGSRLNTWRNSRNSDDDDFGHDRDEKRGAKRIRWKGKTRSRGLRDAALERRFS